MTAPTLVLASSSPRRRHLLEMLGIPILVHPADVQEIPLPREAPEAYARRLARDKARAVPGHLVLGADTIVVLDGEILEKPADADHAVAMLSRLQGRTHEVITAVCLVADGTERVLADRTAVTMRSADEPLLRAYVATGEPMDKAGAYAVQEAGGLLVAGIDGSPHTVVGLPIHRLPELFAAHGLEFWNQLAG
jgi:septum formation protein